MELKCDVCDAAFTARRGSRYCSGRCRTEAYRVRRDGPRPKAPRKPLPETFGATTYDLMRKVEALERLAQDDRFKRNGPALARYRHALMRAAESIEQVAQRLPEPEPMRLPVTRESPVTDEPGGFVSPYAEVAEAARGRAEA